MDTSRYIKVPQLTSVFLLLSLADILLTVHLLRSGGYQESNPVARYFLHGWGLKGLVIFKAIIVAAILVITQAIADRREQAARFVISFACIATGAVVLYSITLVYR